MNVLVVTPSYPVADNPHAGIFIHRQIRNLVAAGVHCNVVVFRPAPPPFPKWLLRRTWVRYFWRARRWKRELDGIPVDTVFYERAWTPGEDVVPAVGRALVAHVEKNESLRETDVVYAHWLWPGGASALALKERFGWPVAAIARGSEMHDWQTRQPACRSYVDRVLREADCVLANCDDLRERAEAQLPGSAARMAVVYNGCDAEQFRPGVDRAAVRRELRIPEQARVLLFCGDVTRRKGLPELAAAWPEFARAHADWILIVVGHPVDADVTAELERACGERLRIVGRVPHTTVTKYMQAADAYVQPSRLEGLSNATMEAMAVGLPVVTTDTCGQRELIENGVNGWLVPPEDVPALRQALVEMGDNLDEAAVRGARARVTIATRFNPRTEAQRLADILRRMMTGSDAKTPFEDQALPGARVS